MFLNRQHRAPFMRFSAILYMDVLAHLNGKTSLIYISLWWLKRYEWAYKISRNTDKTRRGFGFLRMNDCVLHSLGMNDTCRTWSPCCSTLLLYLKLSRTARFVFFFFKITRPVTQVTSPRLCANIESLESRRKVCRQRLLHKVYYSPLLRALLLSSPLHISACDNSCKMNTWGSKWYFVF